MSRFVGFFAAITLVAVFAWWNLPAPPTAADAGISAPMPAWAVLPPGGRVVTSGVYPPQPPYGSAATITYAIDATAEQFAAAYAAQLAAAGYAVRRIPAQFNIAFDEPDLQFEADERSGGHVVYVSFRHTGTTRFVQLTFWDPPAPRLQ